VHRALQRKQSVTCHTGLHSLRHPTQVNNTPHLNCSRAGRYSIYLLQRDGRLSWPWWLIIYRDGLRVCRQSPIQALTGPTVGQFCWSD